jgi:hypothetical protein
MGISIIPQGGLSIAVYPIGFLAPSSNQTFVNYYNRTTTDADTIYTVPAGKTFYVTSIIVVNTGSAGAFSIEDSTSGSFAILGYCSANSMQRIDSSVPIASLAATKVIKAYHAFGTNKMAITMVGFYQ